MFRLAFRNLSRQRARTGLTLASIIVGVVSIVLSGGFVADLLLQLSEATIHSQLGHLQVYRAGYYASGGRNPGTYLIENADRIIEAARREPEVTDTLSRLTFFGLLGSGRGELPIIAEGVEPAKEQQLGSAIQLIDGRALADGDTHGIVIGEGLAQALHLKPGDAVSLLVSTLTPTGSDNSSDASGALNSLEFTVAGTFRSFSREYDARAVRINLGTAQELMSIHAVNAVVLSLRHTEATERVAASLSLQLVPQGFEIKTWMQLSDFYKSTAALYSRQFAVLQIIILVMVVLSVATSVNATLYERTGEFGTLMALGSKSKAIVKLVLLENLLLGLFGGFAGVGIGALVALALSAIGIPMPPPPNSNSGYMAAIQLMPDVLSIALVVGIVSPVLATIIPSRRLMRLEVATALRHNI